MKKKLLLIYGKGTDELRNRQSALGSYIFCLLDLLKDQFDIDVNGIPFNELYKKEAVVLAAPTGKTSGVKKLIPGFVKAWRRDKMIAAGHVQIVSRVKSQNYDLVMEFYTYASRLGITLSQKYNCPLVTVFDSPVLEEYEFFHGKKSFGSNKILRNQNDTLKASAQIVVYSNAVKKYVNQITGKNNNINIHQNVDFTRFDFLEPVVPGTTINIGFIGSFLKWHRVDLLIRIFERLRQQNVDAKLWLVGSGMEFPVIKAQVEKSPYQQDIELTGFCDGEDLLRVKKQMHIGVMPGSNWYGAPNKIFEYGATGLAVMAPATPTISDLFENEKDLLLFEWDNEDSAYEVLKRLCSDNNLLQQLQHNLRDKIRKTYSEENTRKFYTGVFEQALKGKNL